MENEIKILIAEHDPFDLESIDEELQKIGISYITRVAKTELDYINALSEFVPDIILSDYTFPSFDGPTAFKLKEKAMPDIPFIFVSGTIGEERSIELIKNGVTDYVLKDKLFTLNHKIIRAIKDSRIRKQKRQLELELIRSEKHLARAQQLSHIGNWEFDFATEQLTWSKELFRIYGLQPHENVQSIVKLLSFIHPEDLDFVTEKLVHLRESMHNFSLNFRIASTNISIRHIFLDAKLDYSSDNKAIGMYGTVQDVTAMIVLENKLAEERRVLHKKITNAVLTAQETEREHIANELNENFNQMLAAASMYVQLSKTKGNERRAYLNVSNDYIHQAMKGMSKMAKSLKIHSLHILNLTDNITNLIHDLGMTSPLKIELRDDGLPVDLLNGKLQLTIFRIIQEQISNILLHSRATEALIILSRRDNNILLCISDNGEGCDLEQENNGFGITNIKTRAHLFDGRIDILSNRGHGYELKVELSLNSYT